MIYVDAVVNRLHCANIIITQGVIMFVYTVSDVITAVIVGGLLLAFIAVLGLSKVLQFIDYIKRKFKK